MAKLRTRIASGQQDFKVSAIRLADMIFTSFFAQYCFDLGIELYVFATLPVPYYILTSPSA